MGHRDGLGDSEIEPGPWWEKTGIPAGWIGPWGEAEADESISVVGRPAQACTSQTVENKRDTSQ